MVKTASGHVGQK